MREKPEWKSNPRTTVPTFRTYLTFRTCLTFRTFLTFLTFLTFRTFLSFLRRIAGMPDYECHVEHLRHCHPEQPIPTEGEFYEEYLRARYSEGPTRCC